MKTLLGAVGGALAVSAVLVSYNLGARHAMNSDMTMAPTTTQMAVGPDGVVRPYAVRTGEASFGANWQVATPVAQGNWAPYAGAPVPTPVAYGAYPVPVRTVSQTVVEQPAPRPVTRRSTTTYRRAEPERSWQKSALLIGGSAGAGAGLGAIIGGKRGAAAGAAVGGGIAAIFDQTKRR